MATFPPSADGVTSFQLHARETQRRKMKQASIHYELNTVKEEDALSITVSSIGRQL